jgi:hypothetical protein
LVELLRRRRRRRTRRSRRRRRRRAGSFNMPASIGILTHQVEKAEPQETSPDLVPGTIW